MQQTIYIIEDDKNISELIKIALEESSYKAYVFESAESAIKTFPEINPDLIILDIMLPGIDGITAVNLIRKQQKYIPIILLSAKGDELDKITGLNSGADDYMTKPFSVMELIARVGMHLRKIKKFTNKNSSSTSYLLKINDDELKINFFSREVLVNSEIVPLTFKEFELLKYIIENKNKAISREEILNNVWGYNFTGETRTVDIHIKSIRQKIGCIANQIKTVRGFGYKFIDR